MGYEANLYVPRCVYAKNVHVFAEMCHICLQWGRRMGVCGYGNDGMMHSECGYGCMAVWICVRI